MTVTIYTVSREYGDTKPSLYSVSAERRGKTYRLSKMVGAFGYKTVVLCSEYDESVEDAITRYQRSQLDIIEAARRKIAEAEANIEASRLLGGGS